MSYNLFLDDERKPRDVQWVKLPLIEWTIVRNYDEFVDIITKKGLPTFISFDHDLAFEHYPFHEKNPTLRIPYESYKEKTGYHCAYWLINFCLEKKLDLPRFAVHSMNPIGRENIEKLLNGFLKFRRKKP
jgi:hypothetical protein